MKLSREQIVDEAIALLHEQGLKQVTLRNLANRLDMKAPSLFWYFRNKDELLALIDESIFRQCIENIPESGSWQEWVKQYGLSLWAAQSRAPDIPNLITQVNLSQETRQNLFQLLHDKLAPFGLDMGMAMKLQSSIQALVTGWTVLTNVPRHQDDNLATEFSPLRDDITHALDVLIQGWKTEISRQQMDRSNVS